jgi:hypothetical protein
MLNYLFINILKAYRYGAYFRTQSYRLTVTTLLGTYEKIEKSINNLKMSSELT